MTPPALRPASNVRSLLALATFAFAGETGKIAGRVLDDDGQPLVQANVVVSGQTLGAASRDVRAAGRAGGASY